MAPRESHRMNKPLLTIAIPTYNRNEILAENLARLIPQLTEECELLIIDNNSPLSVEESLKNVLIDKNIFKLRIIRNATNIGGAANIIRCFEESSGEWTWLLGDDDQPLDDAIKKITRILNFYKDIDFINFSFFSGQNVDFKDVGFLSLIKNIKSFGNLLFISDGVYKTDFIKSFAYIGYNYIYTAAPHVAMVVAMLKSGKGFFLCKEAVVKAIQVDPGGRWNYVKVHAQLCSLGYLSFLDEKEQQLFSRRIYENYGVTSIRFILIMFMRLIVSSRIYPDEYVILVRYFKQWIENSPIFDLKTFFLSVVARSFYFCLWFPRLSFLLLKFISIFKKNLFNKLEPFSSLKLNSF